MIVVDQSQGVLRGPPDPDLFRIEKNRARWYIDPLPADERWPETDDAWPAVSTVKKAWSKPFRKKLPTGETVPLDAYWAAEYTVEHIKAIAQLDRDGAMALIATCGGRTLNKAARRGTGVHTILEEIAAGHSPSPLLVDNAVQPYIKACEAFVRECQPRWLMTEVVVINRDTGYAGTADAVIEIPGLGVALADWKSRGGDHGAYEEEAAQIGGYSKADYAVIVNPTTGALERVDLPQLDTGLVVSLTAEGYRLFPVDLDQAGDAFLAMHDTWKAHRQGTKAARAAIGKPLILKLASSPAPPADRHAVEAPGGAGGGGAPGVPEPPAPTAPAATPLNERTAWLRNRVARIIETGHEPDLAQRWPAGCPTLRQGGLTDDQVTAVAAACDTVEALHQLPFGPADPTYGRRLGDPQHISEPLTQVAQQLTAASPPLDLPLAVVLADQGRELLEQFDSEAEQRAVADCAQADGLMTADKLDRLAAVAGQVADPIGAVWFAYGAHTVTVVPSDTAVNAMVAGATGGDPHYATTGRSHALTHAKRLAKALELPAPRSLAQAAENPLLAALVAAGHGAADTDTNQENTQP